ncbi:hypothetical protein H5410_027318 [Solanum commersonii]|uniref:Uncharacterized protein n=1 Tax=Solanum commersonii TaxID=4109 RepID=A0A9J5YZJ2_SOLCO|nr:hypothetical protein H5410_027318 [Solanum commersonii]
MEDSQEHNSNDGITPQGAQNRSKADHHQKAQVKQTGDNVNNKSTCIDLMLPNPTNSNILYLDDVVEVKRGMEGGCQEKQTNMQERVSKGGNLSYAMHEGTHIDHSSDYRTLATTSQQQSPTQQKAQYMNIPINVPLDKRTEKCQTNKGPEIDEYAVDNLEDDLDGDNHSLEDLDEDDETRETLIRAFSPYLDQGLEEEIQKVANSQGLSPRVLHHDRFQFKNQDINNVTAGRPNTRLFTSRSSQ